MHNQFIINISSNKMANPTARLDHSDFSINDEVRKIIFPHREVKILRSEHGYGLIVSGDNPVYVQNVKAGSEAAKAGVRSGDWIIKVNGISVVESNHVEVVKLIRSTPEVNLTLSRPPSNMPLINTNNTMLQSSAPNRPLPPTPAQKGPLGEKNITPPQPVDREQQNQFFQQKISTIKLMLSNTNEHRTKLLLDYEKTNSDKTFKEIQSTEKTIRDLEAQLHETSAIFKKRGISPSSSRHSISHVNFNKEEEEIPPPLPARNKMLVTQSSSPSLTVCTPDPPPLPPHLSLPVSENPSLCPVQSTDCVNCDNNLDILPTHHRAKSSPEDINLPSSIKISEQGTNDHCRRSSSYNVSGSWDKKRGKLAVLDSDDLTPPGTPPPPYREGELESSEMSLSELTDLAEKINKVDLSYPGADDDDLSDPETSVSQSHSDDHGPFNKLNELLIYHAYSAVFINYLLSNVDPSSMFFIIITDLYKSGSGKEMRKWVYEIQSTFLLPEAPLRIEMISEAVLHEVDSILQNDFEREDMLRTVFRKARRKAKEEIKSQLSDFCDKRTAGMGTMFGPPDFVLERCMTDKSLEQKTVEQVLGPKLKELADDNDCSISDRNLAIVYSLVTVISKFFGYKNGMITSYLERFPTFATKEKSLKAKLLGRSRKQPPLGGHHFVEQHYYVMTPCTHCHLNIWGIAPQGYMCTNCRLHFHKTCIKILEDTCVGAMQSRKGGERISKLMDKIMPDRMDGKRKTSSLNHLQIEKAKRQHEEKEQSDTSILSPEVTAAGDRPAISKTTEKGNKRPDTLTEGEEVNKGDASASEADLIDSNISLGKRGNAIGRSESYRERAQQKKIIREKRKHSDPNLPHSQTSDADADDHQLNVANSGSSSNSSLSQRWSLDSPSNSLEVVTNNRISGTSDTIPGSAALSFHDDFDSDLEVDPDPPDWQKLVDWDTVKQLKPRERKRQDVINEFFHTERTHLRNLKVLETLFYRPLLAHPQFPHDLMQMLFPNLEEIIDYHKRFSDSMKKRRKENPIVGDIGDILLQMFDGASGEGFQQAACRFCQFHNLGLELLRHRQRRDHKLASFIAEAEANSLCRRLHFKDIIPSGTQRLTKYPLLLESLAKSTPPNTEEYSSVKRSLERSREILNYVNQAVKDAENQHRLGEIQKRLDRSAFDKMDHPIAHEFRYQDITKFKMLNEGSVVWKMPNSNKPVELQVILFEDFILLLQKQDEKFILKFHNVSLVSGKDDIKLTHSPLIKCQSLLVRPVATDTKGFFLVSNSAQGPLIYTLEAPSVSEKEGWIRHITEATEAYKLREGKGKVPTESFPVSDIEQPPPESGADEKTSDAARTPETKDIRDKPDSLEVKATKSDSFSKKADEKLSPSSQIGGQSPVSPSPQRRFQRVEILQIAEGAQLIEPSEVKVSQGHVFTAEPVLTPLEKLRRKDEQIQIALQEKRKLVADILHVPHSEYDHIVDMASEDNEEKEPKELVMVSIDLAEKLQCLVNDYLQVSDEDCVMAASVPEHSRCKLPGVPPSKLLAISEPLNNLLRQLLGTVTERDVERERMRKELVQSRRQLHLYHESSRDSGKSSLPGPCQGLAPSQSPNSSRPNSCVSLGSSCGETSEAEDSGAVLLLPSEDNVGDSSKTGELVLSTECEDKGLYPEFDNEPL